MAQEHVSNTGRIWKVFGILSAVTVVEVYLGILKPDFLHMNNFLSMSLLNWIFFALTIYKAYYIVYAFMHMEGEKKSLRSAVLLPLIILILYLLFILLTEGDYIYEVFKNSSIKWNFYQYINSKRGYALRAFFYFCPLTVIL